MNSAPAVALHHIRRHFGDVAALRDVSLTVQRGEFFSLLGPSGCGKTTLLRIIAGLDFPDSGSLEIAGHAALNTPAHERPVNTVFQSYALFPHLSVRDNVAFGLRMKRVPRDEIGRRVRGVMELTRIAELAARKPAQLSGGQKQRAALARALVNEPQVLLLDEPLGALDLKLRKELQQELRALQRRTGITFIYVTHDQDEALGMSDRIAVMDHGAIVQLGSPAELYEKPRTRFVAQFLGGCNLLAAQVERRDDPAGTIQTSIGPLQLAFGDSRSAIGYRRLAISDTRHQITLAIRPERISLGAGETNHVIGEVLETTYTGAETHSLVRVGPETLRVVSVNSSDATRLKPGDRVLLTLPPEALVVLED